MVFERRLRTRCLAFRSPAGDLGADWERTLRGGMARFFFDLHDDGQLLVDDEGAELPDFEAARTEVQKLLPGIAREKIPHGDHKTFAVLVRDADGKAVYTATLSYAGQWLLT